MITYVIEGPIAGSQVRWILGFDTWDEFDRILKKLELAVDSKELKEWKESGLRPDLALAGQSKLAVRMGRWKCDWKVAYLRRRASMPYMPDDPEDFRQCNFYLFDEVDAIHQNGRVPSERVEFLFGTYGQWLEEE